MQQAGCPFHQRVQTPAAALRFGLYLADVTVDRLQIDASGGPGAAQVIQPPLGLVALLLKVGFGLLQAHALHNQAGSPETLADALDEGLIGEQDDLHTGVQQGGQQVALQKINHGHAVVGVDEDARHERNAEWGTMNDG